MKMFTLADKKAKMTLIGAFLCKMSGALSMIWGSVNIYFFSYLQHQGEPIDETTNSKLLLCGMIPAVFAVVLANPFSRLVGYKNAIKISAFVFTLSPIVINIELNLVTFAVFWLIIPIVCFCLAAIPLINCLWTQFPKDLSKISGFGILSVSVGMIFWNLTFLFFINPENFKAEIGETGVPLFPSIISDRIFRTSNTVYLIAGILFISGSFMVSKRDSTLLDNELNRSIKKKQIPT